MHCIVFLFSNSLSCRLEKEAPNKQLKATRKQRKGQKEFVLEKNLQQWSKEESTFWNRTGKGLFTERKFLSIIVAWMKRRQRSWKLQEYLPQPLSAYPTDIFIITFTTGVYLPLQPLTHNLTLVGEKIIQLQRVLLSYSLSNERMPNKTWKTSPVIPLSLCFII